MNPLDLHIAAGNASTTTDAHAVRQSTLDNLADIRAAADRGAYFVPPTQGDNYGICWALVETDPAIVDVAKYVHP